MKKVLAFSLMANVLVILLAAFMFMFWFIPNFIDQRIGKMAERKGTQFELLAGEPGQVVFLGDSITEGGMWNELFPGVGATNRGIGGDATSHLLLRMQPIYDLKPKKLFIIIGVND